VAPLGPVAAQRPRLQDGARLGPEVRVLILTRETLASRLTKAAVRDTQSMIDVATPERAEEIAPGWPDAQQWGREIRALMRSGGEED
jgi:hypothetical protein